MVQTKLVNGKRVPLSKEDLAALEANEQEAEKRRAELSLTEYRDKRAKAYPSIGDQLDMLYHAMDAGEVPKATEWFKAVKAVKDEYPKPEDEGWFSGWFK